MSTSLGQIPTVAVQQSPGTTGAAGHAALLANTAAINATAAGNASTPQKVRELLLTCLRTGRELKSKEICFDVKVTQ